MISTRGESEGSHVHVQGSGFFSSELGLTSRVLTDASVGGWREGGCLISMISMMQGGGGLGLNKTSICQ